MKQKLYNSILLLPLLALLILFSACQEEEHQPQSDTPVTYRLKLEVSLSGYSESSTRATAYDFVDKDKIYVLFHQGNTTVTGTAVYSWDEDIWTLTPSQSLSGNGRCQLAFFLAAGGASSDAVSLTQQTRIYTDAQATFQLSNDLLVVRGQLSPALGRIRFRGSVGQKCTVSDLALANSFDLKTHSFNLTPSKFTATCAADGYTPYYYCAFADSESRQLTFEQTAESGLRRSFGADVLLAGTSGYVTIPSADSHEGWTLVNLSSGSEITFATVGKPTVSSIRSTRANLAASVTSDGGGRLSKTGFVIAAHGTPTLADQVLDCGIATSLSIVATGLTPETTYYVRAFAVNEAGTTYSEEITFRTSAKDDDPNELDRDEWEGDEDWDHSPNTDGDLERDTWPTDEDWDQSRDVLNMERDLWFDDEIWD